MVTIYVNLPPIEQVLKEAYADTPEFLHGLALMSLRAHLEKLERDTKAICIDGIWKASS